jgi:hypothetical protein
MSSPGFLLSNDSNHDLLQSLLESMNAIIEHQFISKYLILFHDSYVFCSFFLFVTALGVADTVYLPSLKLSEELRLSYYSLIEISMTPKGFQSRSKLAL